MDVDDDEDSEALKLALKMSQGEGSTGSTAEAEPRVTDFSYVDYASIAHTHLPLSQSIKCSECGKIFRNTDEANFHAVKSGHDQFEESTEEVPTCFIFLLPHRTLIALSSAEEAAHGGGEKAKAGGAAREDGGETRGEGGTGRC